MCPSPPPPPRKRGQYEHDAARRYPFYIVARIKVKGITVLTAALDLGLILGSVMSPMVQMLSLYD